MMSECTEHTFSPGYLVFEGFVVKNLSANAGDIRDVGSVLKSGR